MPGRPRKPTSLHVLQGTGRKSRLKSRENEPVIEGAAGAPPDWFSETQREEWSRVSAFPQVNASHHPTLVHHCVLFDRMIQDATGGRPMTASERQTLHSIQMQMGWTAAAQSKVAAPAKEKPVTGWAKFRTPSVG
jgi:hypothetical protein